MFLLQTRAAKRTPWAALRIAVDQVRDGLITPEEGLRRLDGLDQPSQDAVSRIGGIREGVLRRHCRRADGSWRDTAYYSLVAAEWPAVRQRWISSWVLD